MQWAGAGRLDFHGGIREPAGRPARPFPRSGVPGHESGRPFSKGPGVKSRCSVLPFVYAAKDIDANEIFECNQKNSR